MRAVKPDYLHLAAHADRIERRLEPGDTLRCRRVRSRNPVMRL
jgi:hypothetical protein